MQRETMTPAMKGHVLPSAQDSPDAHQVHAASLVIHASIGASIGTFAFDPDAIAATLIDTVELPSRVRYACRHPRLPVLYVACGPGDLPNVLCALRHDDTGRLHPLGEPVSLPARAMEVTTDQTGDHVIVSYDTAPGLTVHRLNAQGGILDQLLPVEPFDTGHKTHSVALLPAAGHAIVVSLGQRGFGSPKYVDGTLGLFRFDRGTLEVVSRLVPPPMPGMDGFNPRNVALHPALPLAYVSIEGQNMLGMIRCEADNFDPTLMHVQTTLEGPGSVRKRQNLGAILVHPQGHAVYLANRNDGYLGGHSQASWLNPDPIPVFPGGENSIAVFRLDPQTGEPTMAQHIDTGGIHPRTIDLDPSGRVLVVGNAAPTRIEADQRIVDVPAGFTFYRVAPDGTLSHAGHHPVEVGAEKLWWCAIAAL